MAHTITLFMWGYQSHFRHMLERWAKRILNEIAPTLEPRSILIGIRSDEKKDGFPVCVNPENDDELDPKIYFNCAKRAEEIYEKHPDHRIFYGDEARMRDKPEIIRKGSLLEAIREVTNKVDLRDDTLSFCGWPTKIEGYYVVPVLQFVSTIFNEYPRLPAAIKYADWISPISFLECVVNRILQEASEILSSKDPGRFLGAFPEDDIGILRDAGKRFCSVFTLANRDVMLQGVFDALNVISSLPYEGQGTIGDLLFALEDSTAVELRTRFRSPVPLHDHRLSRKMIEMSNQDLSCVCHGGAGIVGLGAVQSSSSDSFFRVSFSGHYKWKLFYKNTLLMTCAYGVPRSFAVRLRADFFQSNLRRIFPKIERDAEPRLWAIVEAAMEQSHGTMVVISDAAESEAERLERQSIRIEPIVLDRALVLRLSGIDGAVLVDRSGVCWAIGVILDGMATRDGDPSRGARYNSAIRYVASAQAPTLCVVISEDKYVNLFPKLRPQIDRSEVVKHIELLKTRTRDNCHKVRNWLDDHRFYLTTEQCQVINAELHRIESAPQETQELGVINVVMPPFKPHSEMNDSYYLSESVEAG